MEDSNRPVLILMAGMPGAGKSTVALALGAKFGFPVVDKDVIVSTMLEQHVSEDVAHPLAYAIVSGSVEYLIRVQRLSVIVDTPGGLPSFLEWATKFCAGTGALLIPVLCSADGLVRYDRMAARKGLQSHSNGTTRRPGAARERFSHFPADTIELDTMRPIEEVVREAVARVRSRL